MTKDTSQEISGGKTEHRIVQIPEAPYVSNGRVRRTVQTSGRNFFPRLLRLLLITFYSAASRLLRLLRGEARLTPVYDLVNAGPRHRYALPDAIVSNCVLGAGYGVGAAKFKTVAKTMAGLELTDEESAKAIEDYRRANPLTVAFWREHQNSLAFSARRKDDTHQIELLSGRLLTYWEPRIQGREISAYQTRGANRTYIYGGLATENEVQASCRDILVAAWLAVDKAGLPPVVLSVHDELVIEAKTDEAPQIAKELEHCMVTCVNDWAEGLPLAVEVTISDRYTK